MACQLADLRVCCIYEGAVFALRSSLLRMGDIGPADSDADANSSWEA
jgi:hypothetical protein